jgi:hypothetical protein
LTTSRKPFRHRLIAIGRPMRPSPMKPTVSMRFPVNCGRFALRCVGPDIRSWSTPMRLSPRYPAARVPANGQRADRKDHRWSWRDVRNGQPAAKPR